jgi:hypothetical protein
LILLSLSQASFQHPTSNIQPTTINNEAESGIGCKEKNLLQTLESKLQSLLQSPCNDEAKERSRNDTQKLLLHF